MYNWVSPIVVNRTCVKCRLYFRRCTRSGRYFYNANSFVGNVWNIWEWLQVSFWYSFWYSTCITELSPIVVDWTCFKGRLYFRRRTRSGRYFDTTNSFVGNVWNIWEWLQVSFWYSTCKLRCRLSSLIRRVSSVDYISAIAQGQVDILTPPTHL